jgi:hypothetical protein
MAVGIPAGQSLASKASEAFMDWMRKAAYNIAARSGGAGGMLGRHGLGELITMATTPLHEKELPYTGSPTPLGGGMTITSKYQKGRGKKVSPIPIDVSYPDLSEKETMDMLESMKQQPDLLGFFLKQKTMQQANLKQQTARPTEISQRFKDLPTVTIKEHTKVLPISHEWWSDKVLKALKNLKKGEVVQFPRASENAFVSGKHGGYSGSGGVGIYPKLDIGSYTMSAGKDDQGTYISLFDVWDFGKGYVEKYLGEESILAQMQAPLMEAVGQPFAIYDRYYIPETDLQMELEHRERVVASRLAWQDELAHLLSPMPEGTYSSIGEALKAK